MGLMVGDKRRYKEMNASGQLRMIHPLFVLLMAAVGGVIGWGLFQWNYLPPKNAEGMIVAEFWVWLFLIMCFLALLAIFVIPMWVIFLELFNKQVLKDQDGLRELRTVLILVLSALILAFIVLQSNILMQSVRADIFDVLPKNHSPRVQSVYLSAFIVFLPIALGILLVFRAVHQKMTEIPIVEQGESKLFELVSQLQDYRNLLQNYLLIGGIILSMVPITTAGLRAFLMKVTEGSGKEFPIQLVIIYGLFYTFLLVLLYVPTHLALTEAGRALRDRLCPVNSLSNLKDTVEKRKALDELLQTNMGLGQNLRAGIVTLAPLVTSLVASLLGSGF